MIRVNKKISVQAEKVLTQTDFIFFRIKKMDNSAIEDYKASGRCVGDGIAFSELASYSYLCDVLTIPNKENMNVPFAVSVNHVHDFYKRLNELNDILSEYSGEICLVDTKSMLDNGYFYRITNDMIDCVNYEKTDRLTGYEKMILDKFLMFETEKEALDVLRKQRIARVISLSKSIEISEHELNKWDSFNFGINVSVDSKNKKRYYVFAKVPHCNKSREIEINVFKNINVYEGDNIDELITIMRDFNFYYLPLFRQIYSKREIRDTNSK